MSDTHTRAAPVCVAVVSHVLTPEIVGMFERVLREAPEDHRVVFLLSAEAAPPPRRLPPSLEGRLVQLRRAELLRPGYMEKCREPGWDIAGNLDLAFLEFRRRQPGHERYWFIEYDVHYQGNWGVFFEHFRGSRADVLGTTLSWVRDVPHKLDLLSYPELVTPPGGGWKRDAIIKGFFPICRLSGALLDALDGAYAGGLGGHYELTMPTLAALRGMEVEDIGGHGPFVKPANENRFYFANPATFTHSPGNFVFRPPITEVLPRENTLWHPVKPEGVPAWFPLHTQGNMAKNVVEWLKPMLWRQVIRLWFATRWRPLPRAGG